MTMTVQQYLRKVEGLPDSWCYGMYYVGGQASDGGHYKYLRNDGKPFTSMQRNTLDAGGGTYFLTQQDAQDCLDRYNAATNASNQDTKT